MSLEDKIKKLLEGSVTITGDNLSVQHDENDGDDNDGDQEDTDVSNDEGQPVNPKKDQVNVKEETSLSGEGKLTSAGEDNSKINSGKGRKDEPGSRTLPKDGSAKADTQDDAGDTAKIKKGLSNGDKSPQKLTVKEHMDAMFSGEELSEEFKTKAQTIFEVAVQHAAEQKITELEESFEVKLDEEVQRIEEKLVSQIDEYLDYAVESWVEENQIALESGIRAELVGSFIDGMKNLFKEHYVDVPESKFDVVEEQAQKIEELESRLTELQEEADTANTIAIVAKCENVIEHVSSDLSDVDKDKFTELCEGIDFDTVEDFEAKAKTVYETYFTGKAIVPSTKEEIIESTSPALVNAVVNALRSQTDFSK